MLPARLAMAMAATLFVFAALLGLQVIELGRSRSKRTEPDAHTHPGCDQVSWRQWHILLHTRALKHSIGGDTCRHCLRAAAVVATI
jgi:hypothetical protein